MQLHYIKKFISKKKYKQKIIKLSLIINYSVPYGLAVRIPGFHPGGPGSTPGMGTRSFRCVSSLLCSGTMNRRAPHFRCIIYCTYATRISILTCILCVICPNYQTIRPIEICNYTTLTRLIPKENHIKKLFN